MYLLKLLKHQGMPVEKLSVVAHSLIVSWILYALPAWRGFLSAELSGRLDLLLRRLKRFGYLQNIFRYQDLLDKADEDLFSNMCSSQHCLHHLLPPPRSVDNLRERGHSFILPDYNTKTDKKSFVLRSLSNYLIKSFVHWTWFLSCSRSSFIFVLCVILYWMCLLNSVFTICQHVIMFFIIVSVWFVLTPYYVYLSHLLICAFVTHLKILCYVMLAVELFSSCFMQCVVLHIARLELECIVNTCSLKIRMWSILSDYCETEDEFNSRFFFVEQLK